MSDFTQRFYDDFNDGVAPTTDYWYFDPPGTRNGYISEPAGTQLHFSWALNDHVYWGASGQGYAPFCALKIGSYTIPGSRALYIETLINSRLTASPHECGLLLFNNKLNVTNQESGFNLIWQNNSPTNNRIDFLVISSGVHALAGNTGTITWPGSLYLRIYYNPLNPAPWTNYEVRLDDGYLLSPGWVAGYYKTSGAWTQVGDFYAAGNNVGAFYGGMWAGSQQYNAPASDFGFDYFLLMQEPSTEEPLKQADPVAVEEKIGITIPQPISASTGAQVTPLSEMKPVGAAEEGIRVVPPWSVQGTGPQEPPPFKSNSDAQGQVQPVAVEEAIRILAGQTPTYHASNTDAEGHPYFIGRSVMYQTFYDATKDIWHTPTVPGYNGYGRDGYLYTNGVKQAAQAPWRTEAASADRSSRPDFPLRSMICTTQKEVVIFDLDSWPTSIKVWMRFRTGNYYFISSGDDVVRQVGMANGQMAVAFVNGPNSVGGISCIDFKANNQYALNMIRGDGHYRLLAGKSLVNRNSTTWWESTGSGLTLASRDLTNVAVMNLWSYWDMTAHYVMAGGEDGWEFLYVGGSTANLGQIVGAGSNAYQYSGPYAGVVDDWAGTPAVCFDEDQWVWWSRNTRVFRSVIDHLYSPSKLMQGLSPSLNSDPNLSPAFVTLSHYTQNNVPWPRPSWWGDYPLISCLFPLGDYIYVGTTVGVFRIHRVSMDTRFIYSIAGYGGRGRLDVQGTGEVIAGDQPMVTRLSGFQTTESDYLIVSTFQGAATTIAAAPVLLANAAVGQGGVSLIRMFDDYTITHLPPTLFEDGSWGATGVLY